MRKITTLIIMTTMIFTLGGCQKNTEEEISTANGSSIENNENAFDVKIIATNNPTTPDGMPINLTSQFTGESDRDLQYHWILEKSKEYDDFEGFVVPENDLQNEIINSGEPVKLDLFAEVMWVEGTVTEFKVKLQVEEKDSSTVIATDEITIENNAGIYKIKEG